jgi:hypothetical protein
MATLIFIGILLAAYHLLMEMAIIPYYRLKLKYKLLSLKDNLILLKIRNKEQISNELFEELRTFILSSIPLLQEFSLVRLFQTVREMPDKKDDPSEKEAERKYNLFTNHAMPEIRNLYNDSMKAVSKAFLLNSMAWWIYLLPILIIALGIILISNWYKKMKSWFFYNPTKNEAILILAERQPTYNECDDSYTSLGKSKPFVIR